MSVLETVTVDNVTYDMHDPKVGSGTLSTSAQTLIPAVNELAVPIGKIGSGTLNTTNKTIIPAINELFTNVWSTVFPGNISAARNDFQSISTQPGSGIQITLPYACYLLSLGAYYTSNTSGRTAQWVLSVNGVEQPYAGTTGRYAISGPMWCPANTVIKATAWDYGTHISANVSVTGMAIVFPTAATSQAFGNVSNV